ncbi:hypothetical protein GF356_02890 [candidate division GN15 bacterium]|nr:hypothetical protein [candidate division GN15 bacterium]
MKSAANTTVSWMVVAILMIGLIPPLLGDSICSCAGEDDDSPQACSFPCISHEETCSRSGSGEQQARADDADTCADCLEVDFDLLTRSPNLQSIKLTRSNSDQSPTGADVDASILHTDGAISHTLRPASSPGPTPVQSQLESTVLRC